MMAKMITMTVEGVRCSFVLEPEDDDRPRAMDVHKSIRDIVASQIESADTLNLIGAVHNAPMLVDNITAAIMTSIIRNGMVKES